MGIQFQYGQSDLELSACDTRVLLAPITTTPLTGLEDATNGGLDLTKIGSSSAFVTVGNHEKKAGVKISNKPSATDIMSSGQGSPTRKLFSESKKGITYVPQELKLINLQNSWGFTPSAVSAVSAKGGFTIAIPELPARTLWRAILLAWDTFNGKDIFLYWIANKAEISDRDDINAANDSLLNHGIGMEFHTDPAVGSPVIFGACGAGLLDLAAATADNGLYVPATGITTTPASTTTVTAAAGGSHTRQLTVKDSNGVDRTATATYSSDTLAKATVSSTGLITGVAAGSANVTATYLGFTATVAVTVS